MNRLTVTMTEFKALASGEVEYGFTAGDDYASIWEGGWKSLEAFYADFPNAQALAEYVANKDAFFPTEANAVVVEFLENTAANTMTNDAMYALCMENGVRIVQAEEEEIAGMWDWLDDNGNASDQSFDTAREAMQDAIQRLELQ